MPDLWTKHPDLVRDLLKEAGFQCGVEARFLKGRDPAWTCVFDGPSIKGDLYIHPVEQLRSEAGPGSKTAALDAFGDVGGLALALILGLVAMRCRPGPGSRG